MKNFFINLTPLGIVKAVTTPVRSTAHLVTSAVSAKRLPLPDPDASEAEARARYQDALTVYGYDTCLRNARSAARVSWLMAVLTLYCIGITGSWLGSLHSWYWHTTAVGAILGAGVATVLFMFMAIRARHTVYSFKSQSIPKFGWFLRHPSAWFE